jgi:predicted lactoylglutathione lyase
MPRTGRSASKWSSELSYSGSRHTGDLPGGYAGYLMDPDGHLWEIVWNPQLLPDE